MTLKEKIEVMEAFERGEEVQVDKGYYGCWALTKEPSWNWPENNYRIKSKTKQVVVLETWLISSDSLGMFTIEGIKNYCSNYTGKVRLLSTREVGID